MQDIDIFIEFNKIIKLGEDRLREFHAIRGKVDSYKRVIHAIFDKRVYQKCVDELETTHEALSDFQFYVTIFYKENRRFFSGMMKQYLEKYIKYIKAVVDVSEKRLILQQLILDIKVNKKMKHYQNEIPSMMEDIEKSYERCRLYAVSFNNIADKIHNTQQRQFSRRK
jgi:hypothetical protein